MDKRSTIHALDAEGLVFETNLGLTAVSATNPGNEVVKRTQWIPAWTAAALVCESVGTTDTTTSPVIH